jgi:hypothetical protein
MPTSSNHRRFMENRYQCAFRSQPEAVFDAGCLGKISCLGKAFAGALGRLPRVQVK